MLTAKPKTHGKIKRLPAQAKSSRQNKNSGQKQKANGKSKNSRQNQKLTAKPKTLAAKAKSSRQNQNQRKELYPWVLGTNCARKGCWGCVHMSSKMFCSNCGAETGNLISPRHFWFCREVFIIAVTVVGHRRVSHICREGVLIRKPSMGTSLKRVHMNVVPRSTMNTNGETEN